MAIEFWLAISAGATFLLALAAFLAIRQTRHIRTDDIDREHKARTLKEIRDWAKEGTMIFSEYGRLRLVDEDSALFTRLANLWVEKDAMITAAGEFSHGFEMQVVTAVDTLDDYFTNLGEGRYKSSEMKTKKAQRSFIDDAGDCLQSFLMLSGSIADEKAELKL